MARIANALILSVLLGIEPAGAATAAAGRLNLATKAYASKNYDRVISILNPYTDELENSGLLLLASAYSKKAQNAEEIRVLQIVTAKNEKSYEAFMLLGQAYQKQALLTKDADAAKKIEVQAVQSFRQSLKIQPKFKLAYDSLLGILLEQKDDSDARELLAEGIERFGHRPELMREQCRLDSTDGYVIQAQETCHDAIQLSPSYPDNHVYLGQALYDQKEFQAAEHELADAAQKFPGSEFIQWAAGTVFYKQKEYAVAKRYFYQATKDDPKSGRAIFGYAQSLYETSQPIEALPEFIKACKMIPNIVVDPFFAFGARLRQKGNFTLGEKYKSAANSCVH